MKSIADYFYEKAAEVPNKTAIWCDGNSISYNDLATMVNKYSNYLLDNGVQYGDHIGIPMNNSIESVALILVAANIGVGLVPINPTIPISAIKTAFSTGDVKHLIARKSFFEECEKKGNIDVAGLNLCLDGEWKDALSFSKSEGVSDIRPINPEITGNETIILTMTSGSTGAPKPIDLTQNNKLARAAAHIRLYNITANDNILAATPLYHSLAERLVIIPLIIGATSVLLPRFTPNLWLKCIKEQQVTFTIAVSAQLSQISELLSSPFLPEINSLRCIVSSSALLEPFVRDALIEKLHCDFHEMYGTSEISTATSINFKQSQNKLKSVGKCLTEAQIRIIRDNGDTAEVGEIGEITCKTKLIFNGYYNMPEMTAKAFIDGYFKTGDLGYVDKDGYLYFSGRKKELIITGGINVYPSDVDQCVLQLPEVAECAAFAFPDDRLGEVVGLAVVLKDREELSVRAIKVHCASNLADYQQPHKIFILNQLPKNDMGKLMRSKLAEYVQTNTGVKQG